MYELRVPSHPIDGSLPDWSDLEDEYEWDTLLLGNGLSINVWPQFAYNSLFDYAQHDGLIANDLELFDETPNFERVLADLNTTIRVSEIAEVTRPRSTTAIGGFKLR